MASNPAAVELLTVSQGLPLWTMVVNVVCPSGGWTAIVCVVGEPLTAVRFNADGVNSRTACTVIENVTVTGELPTC